MCAECVFPLWCHKVHCWLPTLRLQHLQTWSVLLQEAVNTRAKCTISRHIISNLMPISDGYPKTSANTRAHALAAPPPPPTKSEWAPGKWREDTCLEVRGSCWLPVRWPDPDVRSRARQPWNLLAHDLSANECAGIYYLCPPTHH